MLYHRLAQLAFFQILFFISETKTLIKNLNKMKKKKLVRYIYNPSTGEAEDGCKFKAIVDYIISSKLDRAVKVRGR